MLAWCHKTMSERLVAALFLLIFCFALINGAQSYKFLLLLDPEDAATPQLLATAQLVLAELNNNSSGVFAGTGASLDLFPTYLPDHDIGNPLADIDTVRDALQSSTQVAVAFDGASSLRRMPAYILANSSVRFLSDLSGTILRQASPKTRTVGLKMRLPVLVELTFLSFCPRRCHFSALMKKLLILRRIPLRLISFRRSGRIRPLARFRLFRSDAFPSPSPKSRQELRSKLLGNLLCVAFVSTMRLNLRPPITAPLRSCNSRSAPVPSISPFLDHRSVHTELCVWLRRPICILNVSTQTVSESQHGDSASL